jgi:hypothetical protein
MRQMHRPSGKNQIHERAQKNHEGEQNTATDKWEMNSSSENRDRRPEKQGPESKSKIIQIYREHKEEDEGHKQDAKLPL